MDRGNKLWEGHRMILPEFRTRVSELTEKEDQKQPQLDETEKMEIAEMLKKSFYKGVVIQIEVYSPQTVSRYTGKVSHICVADRYIKLTAGERSIRVEMDKIISCCIV